MFMNMKNEYEHEDASLYIYQQRKQQLALLKA